MLLPAQMPDRVAFMPLPPEFLQKIRPEDRFVFAFPRSGSRWLRDLVADLFNQHLGGDPDALYAFAMEREKGQRAFAPPGVILSRQAVPDAHSEVYNSSVLPAHGFAAIFKSHHIVEVLRRTRAPLACTVRPPVTTLYAYYSFCIKLGIVEDAVSLREFCQWTLPLWQEHLQTMLGMHWTNPERAIFLHYGDAFPFRVTQLEALARHFNIPCPVGAAEAAVQRQRTFLAQLNADPSTSYPRGENTHCRQQVPDELRQEIEAATAEVYEAAKSLDAAL
jgi:hypothetical protein